MKRQQKLVAVHVASSPRPGVPPIAAVTGEPLAELLEDWRIVQIQPLGTEAGEAGRYTALLLLEETVAGGKESAQLGFNPGAE